MVCSLPSGKHAYSTCTYLLSALLAHFSFRGLVRGESGQSANVRRLCAMEHIISNSRSEIRNVKTTIIYHGPGLGVRTMH